jgi:G3E family GTPase
MGGGVRTPVVLVAGQGDTEAVARALLQRRGTLVVTHRVEGHVVVRGLTMLRRGAPATADYALELSHGCVSCTVRNDLLVLLRRLHRRRDVDRVVVHLGEWLEPQSICWAIEHVRVSLGPGYVDGPAARDVRIAGVVCSLDPGRWLEQALGDDTLEDGRTVAQVVVGQAEFADVMVDPWVDHDSGAVLARLNPRGAFVREAVQVEDALAALGGGARLGRGDDPVGPLLVGQPPLEPDGPVGIVEFISRRPFHPHRLHDALDVLLDGVVRARGRIWTASQPDLVMCLESAGGGLRVSTGGKWLAAMSESEVAASSTQRRALASLLWEEMHGDRHTSLVVLVCGAHPEQIKESLQAALLSDSEMSAPESWPDFGDPFGDWHEEPCADSATESSSARAVQSSDED